MKSRRQNRLRNKILALILTGWISLGVGLTGCTMQGNEAELQLEESDQIRFSWWGNDERHAYTMQALDLFREEHPEIEIRYQYGQWSGYEKRNKVFMESHTEADLMQINYAWLTEYSADGEGFYDLYQLKDFIDLDNFTKKDLQFGEQNGKLNAIPIAFNTATVFYNKSIYDRYGMKLPTTWEDYFEAAKVMREDGIYPMGMTKKQLFLFLVAYYEQTTGSSVCDSKGAIQIDEEGIRYMLTFYKRLLDEKVVPPMDRFDRTDFTSGKVAGTMCWVSDAGNYCSEPEANGDDIELGEYPEAPDAKLSGWYMKPATMYAISSITEHPKEAAELLNFLLNSEEMAKLQKTEKGVPVSSSARKALQETGELDGWEAKANQKMLDERDWMQTMVPALENEALMDAFKAGAYEYVYGRQTCEEAAGMIYKEIQGL